MATQPENIYDEERLAALREQLRSAPDRAAEVAAEIVGQAVAQAHAAAAVPQKVVEAHAGADARTYFLGMVSGAGLVVLGLLLARLG